MRKTIIILAAIIAFGILVGSWAKSNVQDATKSRRDAVNELLNTGN